MNKKKIQAVIFSSNENGEKTFLLLKTNKRRGHFWQNVTGSVENNETFLDAAYREVREETNCDKPSIINIKDLDLDFEFTDQWECLVQEKIYSFHVNSDFLLEIDSDEHIDYKWVAEKDINRESVKFKSNYEAIEKCINS